MSFKVYPITKTTLFHNGYSVKINGKKVDLQTARVSAVPFNRRWPGHQRSIDQTELINFILLEADEPLTFEITARDEFEKVDIRPINLGVKPQTTNNKNITFTVDSPAYFTVEPYGRQNALHVFIDPISNYAIEKNAENVIYFGKGEHDVGMIHLESNQTLFIDEGAVVYACVRATDAENIKIVGRGILDNSKNKAKILFEASEENNFAQVNNAVREHTIQLEYCTNVKIEGITIRDSLVYNIKPVACKNIDISNVKIIGCWRYNSDGIDMHNCENVMIDNCFIRTFDDSICVKGFDCFYEGDIEKAVHEAMYRNGKSYDVFKNVRISNCVIWNDWGKSLEIGAETRGEEICDIVYDNCHIIHVTGRVLDCMNVDYAHVHDVIYQNITVELDDLIPPMAMQKTEDQKYENNDTDYAPFLLSSQILYHKEYSANGERRGKNTDFTYKNIKIYGRHMPKFDFSGYDEQHKVANVTVEEIHLNDKPLGKDEYTLQTNGFSENIKVIITK